MASTPGVLLKPSGLDWLGCMPAHWEPVRLIRCRVADVDQLGRTTVPLVEERDYLSQACERSSSLTWTSILQAVRTVAGRAKLERREGLRPGETI